METVRLQKRRASKLVAEAGAYVATSANNSNG